MRDRLLTFAAAVAALLVAFIFLKPPHDDGHKELSLPTTEDAGVEGLKALKTWLEQGGIPLLSLRKRYPELANSAALAESGNLLIVSLPFSREALRSEWQALIRWIGRGNSLLILGHAYNRQPWSGTDDCLCDAVRLLKDLEWKLTKLMPERAKGENDRGGIQQRIESLQSGLQGVKPVVTEIFPLTAISLTKEVERLESRMMPALLDETWHLSTASDQLALRAFTTGLDRTVVWQIEAGEGRIFLSLAGDIFSNEMLNRAGNARLFKNLLSLTLARDGRVIFDDYHFGLSDLYDPEQFFRDSRLHRTIGLVIVFWFIYVLGYSNRLAPVRAKKAKVSVLDSVEAMAGFFAGRLDKKMVARELTRHLLQDIRLKRHLRDEEAVWRWLERHPQILDNQIDLMREAAQQRCSRLNLLTDTLSNIRTKILS
ncbi:DUF4350 domain-containing protein [Methylomarinum vadi]|uniref:DUF4350 domain-containing protein n=1 Tax=Methylomarinum vadi TaxID=438855 RepID=UPI0004DF382C|nr:DUF4350 domain-containing protein [Methylomarinum vadi]